MYLQLKTLFFFCLHFLQKGKKNTHWKTKTEQKNPFLCARARLCVSVFYNDCACAVTDANKKEERGRLCPGDPKGPECAGGWPGWPLGSLGRKERGNLRICKFREETGAV